MTTLMALLLDLSNLIGGFLLAAGLLAQIPRAGGPLRRATTAAGPFAWIVGVVALVAAGYWVIVHVFSGPHLFHFEMVGLAVGVVLLWDRLTGRPRTAPAAAELTGVALLIAVLGIIALVVGIQGLSTPVG